MFTILSRIRRNILTTVLKLTIYRCPIDLKKYFLILFDDINSLQ